MKSELCSYAAKRGKYTEANPNRDTDFYNSIESIIKEGYSKIAELEAKDRAVNARERAGEKVEAEA